MCIEKVEKLLETAKSVAGALKNKDFRKLYSHVSAQSGDIGEEDYVNAMSDLEEQLALSGMKTGAFTVEDPEMFPDLEKKVMSRNGVESLEELAELNEVKILIRRITMMDVGGMEMENATGNMYTFVFEDREWRFISGLSI